MEAVAILAVVPMLVLTLFQLALAAGAPWGAVAYGGNWPGVMPKGLRINSLVFGLAIYPIAMFYVLDAGGVSAFTWLPGSRVFVMWVLAVLFAVGALANFTSHSKPERLWGPVALLIAVCCAVLALG